MKQSSSIKCKHLKLSRALENPFFPQIHEFEFFHFLLKAPSLLEFLGFDFFNYYLLEL